MIHHINDYTDFLTAMLLKISQQFLTNQNIYVVYL